MSDNQVDELTVMVINIESLPSNFAYFTSTLTNLKFAPDIIGLSETKITETVNSYYNPHIENYDYYPSPKSTNRAGSAGVFIKSSISATLRFDLDISVPGLFETLWFDINHSTGGKKSTFGIVYRHPGVWDIPFLEHKLESALAKLNQKKSDFYIFGDFNCDTLRQEEFSTIINFVQMMHSYSAVNLINKPTRFPRGNQSGAPSILDHFYTNQISKIKNVGLIVDDISDHFPIVATIRLHSKKQPFHLSPFIRDFRNFDAEAYNQSLATFRDIESDRLDTRFYNYDCHLSLCLNIYHGESEL